jgi:hypothetical protein
MGRGSKWLDQMTGEILLLMLVGHSDWRGSMWIKLHVRTALWGKRVARWCVWRWLWIQYQVREVGCQLIWIWLGHGQCTKLRRRYSSRGTAIACACSWSWSRCCGNVGCWDGCSRIVWRGYWGHDVRWLIAMSCCGGLVLHDESLDQSRTIAMDVNCNDGILVMGVQRGLGLGGKWR